MQKNIENKINSIKRYECGYCTNNLAYIFKKAKREKRDFPANAFLINHNNNLILYDTGYSLDIYNIGILGYIYNLINPVTCTNDDEIINQLSNDKINAFNIDNIIVSHLHPDHIAGLKFFPNSQITISDKTYKLYKENNIRNLIFKNLLPNDFSDRLNVIKMKKNGIYFNQEYDFFNDGSIILTEMNGHSLGQICILFPNEKIFLSADSCWGTDLIDKSFNMSFISKMIQNNYESYVKSLEMLKKLIDEDIQIYPSHEKIKKKELII